MRSFRARMKSIDRHMYSVLSNARCRRRVACEIIELLEEPHRRVATLDEVVQQKVVDVSAEIPEEVEEVAVRREYICRWAHRALVMAADALKGQIETIANSGMGAAALVDRPPPLPVHPDLHREDKVTTHRACQVVEGRYLRGRTCRTTSTRVAG